MFVPVMVSPHLYVEAFEAIVKGDAPVCAVSSSWAGIIASHWSAGAPVSYEILSRSNRRLIIIEKSETKGVIFYQ